MKAMKIKYFKTATSLEEYTKAKQTLHVWKFWIDVSNMIGEMPIPFYEENRDLLIWEWGKYERIEVSVHTDGNICDWTYSPDYINWWEPGNSVIGTSMNGFLSYLKMMIVDKTMDL